MEDPTANETYNDLADGENKSIPRVSIDNHDLAEDEDEMTKENEAAVTQERRMIYEDNTNRLRSILENIKNSTKTVRASRNECVPSRDGGGRENVHSLSCQDAEGES